MRLLTGRQQAGIGHKLDDYLFLNDREYQALKVFHMTFYLV